MKTITESGFLKVENEVLREKLYQLSCEFPIGYIFYDTGKTTEPAHITIVTTEPGQVESIASRNWIRNSREKSNALFHVISQGKINFEYREGNPFMACYCRKSAIVYQNPEAKGCPEADWRSFKKRFKRYRENYYHDHDILLSEANRFQKLGSLTGMFLSFLNIYEYNIHFLEILCIGHAFDSIDLHERIKQLAHFIPAIEGVFVKKSGKEYYLVAELEEAKEVAEGGDEIRLNDSLYESIAEVELKLYQLVSNRFSELKRQIKSNIRAEAVKEAEFKEQTTGEDKELSQLISQIVTIQAVEEIYLLYQTQNSGSTTYFLLLIGERLGTETLSRIQQSVTAKSENKLTVVLLGHSRFWIQSNLFCHQAFFKKVMIPENLKFQSTLNHPSIHWEKPYTPEFPDLDHFYHAAVRIVKQYFVLRENADKNNTEGISELFGKSLLRIFRTQVYSTLSYLPNYLSAFSLWKLCVFAEPELEKLEFLFEKCSGEHFFRELNNHNRFHYGISRLKEEELLTMDEILQLLLQKLEVACSCVNDKQKEKCSLI
ncbi:MAG: hypothetical protein PQJ28_03870 [Spirochaetales bacterium]|nr:hypothetical protein [Spirochaetales bacterium]